MRYCSLLLICLFILVFTATGHAEFYKYTNEKGEVIYTDDISRIPAEKRGEVDVYTESYSDFSFEDEEMDDINEEDMPSMRNRLDLIREGLENEFNEISTEKEQLDAIKETLHTGSDISDIEDYNERLDALNTRIDLYEQKRIAFESQTQKYNDRIKEMTGSEDNNEEGNGEEDFDEDE